MSHPCNFSLPTLDTIGSFWYVSVIEQRTGHDFTLMVARVNSGHSIRSLAAQLGIDQRTLARLERGLSVSPVKAKVVADFFGVLVTDLMPVERQAA